MSWLPDWITGFDRDNYEAGQRADAALQVLNQKKALQYEDDYGAEFADEWRAETAKNMAISDRQLANPDEQIEGAFWEGWNEGGDAIRNGIGSTINTTTGSIFRLIPWQVWLAGAAYGAFKLGLFKGLLKK
jgi:hypothetical protein